MIDPYDDEEPDEIRWYEWPLALLCVLLGALLIAPAYLRERWRSGKR